ncbi:MAG: hypothetical protein ACI9JM_000511 [Halioglobus sp.]
MNSTLPSRAITARVFSFFLLLLAALPWSSHSFACVENRAALMIGNANYADMPLDNPTNDASAVTVALQEPGFEVITVLNADLGTM